MTISYKNIIRRLVNVFFLLTHDLRMQLIIDVLLKTELHKSPFLS